MAEHPRPEELRHFRTGRLPDDRLDEVAAHLDTCSDCQATLTTSAADDPLLTSLRRPIETEPHAGEPECAAALETLARTLAARQEGVSTPTLAATTGWYGPAPRPDDPFPVLPHTFGRYQVRRPLGRGGMGAVYLAQDTTLDRPVALKVSRFDRGDGDAGERFLREARAAAGLQHEGLCRVLDYGVEGGTLFLTMEYIDGEPLSARLADDTPQDARWSAELVRRVAEAVESAHGRGIVHRDLKPANIMLGADGRPRVVDFGVARRDGDSTLTQAGVAVGTPAYMSPEQIQGDPVTPATDVYSLGVILYQLLTGRLPSAGKNLAQLTYQIVHGTIRPPSDHRPDLDPALGAVCLKAMARSAGDRYASMADMAADLEEFLRPRPGAPRTFSRRSRPDSREGGRRRGRVAAALAGRWWQVFFLLFVAVGLFAAVGPRLGRKPADPGTPIAQVDDAGAFAAVQPKEGRKEFAHPAAAKLPAPPHPGARSLEFGPRAVPMAMSAEPSPKPKAFTSLIRSAVLIASSKGDGKAGGSGVLIDRAHRLVVTNAHNVNDDDHELVAHFPRSRDGKVVLERDAYLAPDKGQPIRCRVVARAPQHDLALLELDRVPPDADALPVAADSPKPGEVTHALGNPRHLPTLWAFSSGAVRRVIRQRLQAEPRGRPVELNVQVIETQTPVNRGDSGGPVVNDRGELVGITSGAARAPDQPSLFIDRSEVTRFVESYFVLSGGRWERPAAAGEKRR